MGGVVDRRVVCWPVSMDVVVAVDMSEMVSVLFGERGPGPGLTLALAADSSQPAADSSLLLPDSSLPMPDPSLFGFCGF